MNELAGLIPAPKKARLTGGQVKLAGSGRILMAPGLFPGAETAAQILQGRLKERFGLALPVEVAGQGPVPRGSVLLSVSGDRAGFPGCPSPEEGYRVSCRGGAVALSGVGEAGLRHAVWTLLALVRKGPGGVALSSVEIEDWPSLAFRGVMEDVSRGKIPTLESLKSFASQLAEWKFNAMQLYVEHTFFCRKHPEIGRGWSPLTPRDIRELDAHCRSVGIELVPSMASFGHLDHLFDAKKYRKLCVGKPWRLINPLAESSYRFLDGQYSEYMPCFSSRWFNVNCDETYDLGTGKSEAVVKRLGKGEVYLRHILRLYDLVTKKYGKRMMMWGDIIGHYPRLIPRLPKDIIMLPWGYFNRWRPAEMRPYVRSRLAFIVCPGTSAWHSPAPWTHTADTNISSAAFSAKKTGGLGIMTTDWGDGGHQQPLGLSWNAFAGAAEQGWSGGATPQSEVDRRFSLSVFGDARGEAGRLWRVLGRANEALRYKVVYIQWWYSVNFGLMFYENDLKGEIFTHINRGGVRRLARVAASADSILRKLEERRAGPPLLRRELRYSVDMLVHLAAKLDWMMDLKEGRKGPSIRARGRALLAGLAGLRRGFLALWNARNRPHRREITLGLYDKSAKFYRKLLASV